jgi:hypothetical protein
MKKKSQNFGEFAQPIMTVGGRSYFTLPIYDLKKPIGQQIQGYEIYEGEQKIGTLAADKELHREELAARVHNELLGKGPYLGELAPKKTWLVSRNENVAKLIRSFLEK